MATFTGTGGADDLVGTGGDDLIQGLGGEDILIGGGGSDTIEGGDGGDLIFDVYSDFDTVLDPLSDVLVGGRGNDHLYGTLDDDFDGGGDVDRITIDTDSRTEAVDIDLSGQPRNDVSLQTGGRIANVESVEIYLRRYDNRVVLGSLAAEIHGGDGNDTLIGGSGNDKLEGVRGIDRLLGGGGSDTLDAGDYSGFDVAGEYADGGSGNDTVYGGVNDTLRGGTGDDYFTFRHFGVTEDIVVTQTASGTLRFSTGALVTGFERGYLELGGGDDLITLTSNGITAFGGNGNDTVVGSDRDDVFYEDPGNDRYVGSGGSDTVGFDFDDRSPPLVIDLRKTQPQATGDGLDTFIGIENLTVLTSAATDEHFIGNASDNMLDGGFGSDTLVGNGGDDTLNGLYDDLVSAYQDDRDSLNGGGGNDILFGGTSGDTLQGGSGIDTFRYTHPTETTAVPENPNSPEFDLILDLSHKDIVDLVAVDAIDATADDDAFVLVAAPTETAGSAYWTYDAARDVSSLHLVTGWSYAQDGDASEPVIIEATGDHRNFDGFLL